LIDKDCRLLILNIDFWRWLFLNEVSRLVQVSVPSCSFPFNFMYMNILIIILNIFIILLTKKILNALINGCFLIFIIFYEFYIFLKSYFLFLKLLIYLWYVFICAVLNYALWTLVDSFGLFTDFRILWFFLKLFRFLILKEINLILVDRFRLCQWIFLLIGRRGININLFRFYCYHILLRYIEVFQFFVSFILFA